MKKRFAKALSLTAVAMFTLTGCVKMDATVEFAEGKVQPTVVTRLSSDFIELDESLKEDLGSDDFKSASPEKLQKFCEIFSEDTQLSLDSNPANVTQKGVDEDGTLVCESKGEAVSVSELGDDVFTVTYDEKAKAYTVKGDLAGFVGSSESGVGGLDGEQLKKLGAEFNMHLNFNKVDSVTFDDEVIAAGTSSNGITVSEESVSVDLLAAKEGVLEVRASDTSLISLFMYLGLAAFGVALLGAAVVLVLRTFRNDEAQEEVNVAPVLYPSPEATEASLPDVSTPEDDEDFSNRPE